MSQSLRVTCANCGRQIYAISKVTDANRADVMSHAFSLKDSRDAHLFHLGCTLAVVMTFHIEGVAR